MRMRMPRPIPTPAPILTPRLSEILYSGSEDWRDSVGSVGLTPNSLDADGVLCVFEVIALFALGKQ